MRVKKSLQNIYCLLLILLTELFSSFIQEDFITSTYQDPNYTTALWDTTNGILTIPKHIGIIDQAWENGSYSSAIGQLRYMAQTFTTSSHFTQIGRVEVYLTYGLGTPVDIKVEIRTVNEQGHPTNEVIGVATIYAFNSPAFPSHTWFNVDFKTPVSVKPSTKYAIVLSCPNSDTRNVYYWRYGFDYPGGGYPYGTRVNSFDGGLTWQVATWEDFMFKIYSPQAYTIAPGYLTQAYAQSLGYDTGYPSVKYLSYDVIQTLPEGTYTKFFFSDSSDNLNFSEWTSDITTLSKRFIRFKIILQTTQMYDAPVVDLLRINFIPQPPPRIYSIHPTSGPISGADKIEIKGENFLQDTKVFLGNIECEKKSVTQDTIIFLTPKSETFGQKNLFILNPDGQSTELKNSYNYLPLIKEDFTTHLYRDAKYTNALWDTTNEILTLAKSGYKEPDQAFIEGSYYSAIGQKRYMAQTFTAGPNLTSISRVDVCLTYGLGTPMDLIIEIRTTDTNGNPTNQILATAIIQAFDTPPFPHFQWFSAIFVNPVKVDPNTRYALVLSCPYSETTNVYYWRYGFNYPSGGYPGGSRVNSFDGGLTWQIATWEDFLFQIFPTPLTYSNTSVAQSLPYDTAFDYITYTSYEIKQNLPFGTNTSILFSDSSDRINWSDWTSDITLLSKRYIRWKTQLFTEDTSKTPTVDTIIINYLLKHFSPDKMALIETKVSNITFEIVSSTPMEKSAFAIRQEPTLVSDIYKIGPEGTLFDPPAILTFYYSDANNDGYEDKTGVAETSLKIYTYNPTTGLWEALSNQTIDTQNNLIKAEITHLSLFALLYLPIQEQTTISSSQDEAISAQTEATEVKQEGVIPSQEELIQQREETTVSPQEEITPQQEIIPSMEEITVHSQEEITVKVDIDPDTMNLKSEGEYITVYITHPLNFKNITIDYANIYEVNDTLIEPISAEDKFYKYEENKFILKFKRQTIKSILPLGEVKIKIKGVFRIQDMIIKFKGSGVIKVIEPGRAELITKSKTQINSSSGVELTVPENSVKEDIVLVVNPIKNEDLTTEKKIAAELQGLKIISGVSLQPEGFTFERPIDAFFNIPNENLKLYRWNEKEKEWEEVEDPEVSKEKIKTKIKSLSVYCIMETLSTPTFKFFDAYVYPNPAKFENPVIRIECGIADSLKIKIFDISGELIHDAEIQGSNYITNCYEYVWDVRNVETGVYICLIRAEKQNHQPIEIVEKIVIIK